MSKRRGLPESSRMRHDSHFVDQLVRADELPVGRRIAIHLIEANPDQPRSAMGDLAELTKSIADKGVLEPILVRPARRRPFHDHLRRAAIPRRARRRTRGDPVHRDGRPGQRAPGDRAHRKPAAQGSQSVRRSGRLSALCRNVTDTRTNRLRMPWGSRASRSPRRSRSDGCRIASRPNVGAPTSARAPSSWSSAA